jgi:uncharacterized protein YbaP (TraB family)
VEPNFLKWANDDSKPISYLETPQELVNSFESVPVEEVLAGINLIASDLSACQRQLCDIHKAWLAQDLKDIYQVASQSPSFGYPGLRSALLDSRNRAWTSVIQEILGTPKRTLIVVGALHLYGANNLVEHLGLEVERVNAAAKS